MPLFDAVLFKYFGVNCFSFFHYCAYGKILLFSCDMPQRRIPYHRSSPALGAADSSRTVETTVSVRWWSRLESLAKLCFVAVAPGAEPLTVGSLFGVGLYLNMWLHSARHVDGQRESGSRKLHSSLLGLEPVPRSTSGYTDTGGLVIG